MVTLLCDARPVQVSLQRLDDVAAGRDAPRFYMEMAAAYDWDVDVDAYVAARQRGGKATFLPAARSARRRARPASAQRAGLDGAEAQLWAA